MCGCSQSKLQKLVMTSLALAVSSRLGRTLYAQTVGNTKSHAKDRVGA